ncbi:hypothetical protein [Streptosporangium sp. NPDC051022]|uniref:hypothetical protein n=1 Tax=Streptosporangium sp. NPDC051022 TaxID=3155752 RepID=UPI00343AF8A0
MLDEVMTRSVLWHLSVRLPNWTIWYGEHTEHFWALFKGKSSNVLLYVEARIATDLESKAVEIEQRLLGSEADSPEAVLLTGENPTQEVERSSDNRHPYAAVTRT